MSDDKAKVEAIAYWRACLLASAPNHEGAKRGARANPPSCKNIVAAWMDTRPWGHLVDDDDDAADSCWRCGYHAQKGEMTRAHIHAHRHGGSNDPSNYFLLCDICHREQPDAAPREEQIQWVSNGEWYLTKMMEDKNLMGTLQGLCDIAVRLTAEDSAALMAELTNGMRAVSLATSSGGERAAMILYIRKLTNNLSEWI